MSLYTFASGSKKKIKKLYTFVNGSKKNIHTMYTFVNGVKSYIFLPLIDKPAYYMYRDILTSGATNKRKYYKVYLDGTSTSTTFTHDFGYETSTSPYFSGHKYDPGLRRMVIWANNATSITQNGTVTYKIYNMGNHSLVKTLSHTIEYPCSNSSNVYNHAKHLLLTMFSGFNNNGTTETLNPRYLRIIDLANLRILTKSFTWPNGGKRATVLGCYYMSSSGKLRVLCREWYNTTGFPVLQNQSQAINVYEVNLTSDESNISPIFTHSFNVLAQPYWSYMCNTRTWSWDSPIMTFNPASGSATIGNYTRAVCNNFYTYNFNSNNGWNTSHEQSYCASGTYGGIIKSPNGSHWVSYYIKWDNLAQANANIFRYSTTNGVTTPASGMGATNTTGTNVGSWNEDYCYAFKLYTANSGRVKFLLYSTNNNDTHNSYEPTIYDAVNGTQITTAYSASTGSSVSEKYIAFYNGNKSNGNLRYHNIIDKSNISSTIKLDSFTNSAWSSDVASGSATGIFVY